MVIHHKPCDSNQIVGLARSLPNPYRGIGSPPPNNPGTQDAGTRVMPLEIDEQYRLIDVLDRILDRGIVIDTWVRVSLVGIDFITLEGRMVVASIETYLRHADALSTSPHISPAPRR